MEYFILFRKGERTNIIGSMTEISKIINMKDSTLKDRWRRLRQGAHIWCDDIPVLRGSVYDSEEYMRNIRDRNFKPIRLSECGQKRIRHGKSKRYVIYNRYGDVIFTGSAEECSDRLIMNVSSFYSIVHKCKEGNFKKYHVVALDD